LNSKAVEGRALWERQSPFWVMMRVVVEMQVVEEVEGAAEVAVLSLGAVSQIMTPFSSCRQKIPES
jgi:hypothetical protein